MSPKAVSQPNPQPTPAEAAQAALNASNYRPVPAFMAALTAKLGWVWDMLVLQVHNDNDHALSRFKEKYGFHYASEFDEKKHHLVGMVKRPQAAGGGVAAAKRRHADAKEARKAKRMRPVEEQSPAASTKRRPRRAASSDVNYAPPPDLRVTNHDLLPNW